MECYNTIGMQGLGDVSKASAITSSSASTIANYLKTPNGVQTTVKLLTPLLGVATASQVVPIAGQVIGVIAITAGFIASAQAKAKAIKGQKEEVDAQNQQLRELNGQYDQALAQTVDSQRQINMKLQALNGLSGLGSLKTFFQKTFTPAKYAQGQLNESLAENERLTNQINEKDEALKALNENLQQLFDQLTKGIFKQNTKQILIYAGIGLGVAGALFGLYLLADNNKWI